MIIFMTCLIKKRRKKMKYTKPEMDVILFKRKDLVRTSPLNPDGTEDGNDTTGGEEGGWGN